MMPPALHRPLAPNMVATPQKARAPPPCYAPPRVHLMGTPPPRAAKHEPQSPARASPATPSKATVSHPAAPSPCLTPPVLAGPFAWPPVSPLPMSLAMPVTPAAAGPVVGSSPAVSMENSPALPRVPGSSPASMATSPAGPSPAYNPARSMPLPELYYKGAPPLPCKKEVAEARACEDKAACPIPAAPAKPGILRRVSWADQGPTPAKATPAAQASAKAAPTVPAAPESVEAAPTVPAAPASVEAAPTVPAAPTSAGAAPTVPAAPAAECHEAKAKAATPVRVSPVSADPGAPPAKAALERHHLLFLPHLQPLVSPHSSQGLSRLLWNLVLWQRSSITLNTKP